MIGHGKRTEQHPWRSELAAAFEQGPGGGTQILRNRSRLDRERDAMKDGLNYSAVFVAGAPVGGFSPIPGEGGWLTYITVDDVDARVAKAKAAGATIIAKAMTVRGVGRMATIADPFGVRLAFIDYSKA
jgi:predicted enzyme related to lactoylglutathione lyase